MASGDYKLDSIEMIEIETVPSQKTIDIYSNTTKTTSEDGGTFYDLLYYYFSMLPCLSFVQMKLEKYK